MDVMSTKDEPVACFGPPCSDPVPSFWFALLTPVQLARPDDRHQDSIMNQIVSLNTASTLTMSSREIAKLTGKRHDNVRADIDKMARELSLSFQEKPEATAGRPILAYHLPKRETLILVSGYTVALRARIIDRWMELEASRFGGYYTAANGKRSPCVNLTKHGVIVQPALQDEQTSDALAFRVGKRSPTNGGIPRQPWQAGHLRHRRGCAGRSPP